jgi:hypothetical protein
MSRFRWSVLLLVLVLASCADGLFHPPAAPGGLSLVSLEALLPPAGEPSASLAEAFSGVDRVQVRLERARDGEVLLDEVFTAAPEGGEIRLQLEVELDGGAEPYTLFVELRRGAAALFRAEGSVELAPGVSARPVIDMVPIPASVRIDPQAPPTLVSIGETFQLEGAVLFATGVPIPGLQLTWTSLDGTVASVSGSGLVTAVGAGSTQVRVGHAGLTAQVPISVEPVPASVQVTPAEVEVPLGGAVQLSATVRDALGNTLGIPVEWTSVNPQVASVSQAGVVRGEGRGSTEVRARAGDAIGTATVEVVASPPQVQTLAAQQVTTTSAELRGSVTTGGLPTTTWIEWGLTPSPLSMQPMQTFVVPGSIDQTTVVQDLTGRTPARGYYYRIVAENDEGRTEGEVRSFATLTDAPVPSNVEFSQWGELSGPELYWSFPSGDFPGMEFGIQLRRSSSSTWTTVDATRSTWFEFDRPFDGGVRYLFRVRACSGAVCTGFSTPVEHLMTGELPWVDLWPATDIQSTSATLPALISDGYLATEYFFEWGTHPFLVDADTTPVRSVERASYSGAPPAMSSSSGLESPTEHVIEEFLTGLQTGTTYYFRGVARNAQGTRTSTGIHRFAAGARPQGPLDLTVTQGAYGGHDLSWSYPTGGPTPSDFEIERREGATGEWRVIYRQWGGSSSYVDWYTGSQQLYGYRVRACFNEGGCSNPSPMREITSVDLRPQATTLEADQLTPTQARLRGELRTGGVQGAYSFEWSMHSNMSLSVETPRVRTATGIDFSTQETWLLDELIPGRTYYYRLRVENEFGVVTGAVRPFTTPN